MACGTGKTQTAGRPLTGARIETQTVMKYQSPRVCRPLTGARIETVAMAVKPARCHVVPLRGRELKQHGGSLTGRKPGSPPRGGVN